MLKEVLPELERYVLQPKCNISVISTWAGGSLIAIEPLSNAVDMARVVNKKSFKQIVLKRPLSSGIKLKVDCYLKCVTMFIFVV